MLIIYKCEQWQPWHGLTWQWPHCRNLPRLVKTVIPFVMTIYVLVVTSYFTVMSKQEMISSEAIGVVSYLSLTSLGCLLVARGGRPGVKQLSRIFKVHLCRYLSLGMGNGLSLPKFISFHAHTQGQLEVCKASTHTTYTIKEDDLQDGIRLSPSCSTHKSQRASV